MRLHMTADDMHDLLAGRTVNTITKGGVELIVSADSPAAHPRKDSPMRLKVTRRYLVCRVQTILVDAPEGFDLAAAQVGDYNFADFDEHVCNFGTFLAEHVEFVDEDDLTHEIHQAD